MLQEVFDQQSHQQQFQIDEISSPIGAQIFDFCDPDLFSETLQNNPEVTSCSNGCCYEENSSSLLPSEIDKIINNGYQDNNAYNNTNINSPPTTTPATTTTATTSSAVAATNNNNGSNMSMIFDSQEVDNDISASIDISPSPPFYSVPQFLSTQQFQFDFSSSSSSSSSINPNQIPIPDAAVNVDGGLSVSNEPINPLLVVPPLMPSIFVDDCLSSVPSYVPLNPASPSCSFLGPYMPFSGSTMAAALSADSTGIFNGSLLRSSELQPQELDFQCDNGGVFCPDSLLRVFNPRDLQAPSGESQQMVGVLASTNPIPSEISSLEDSAFKVGKLSVEQRKEKIHRYMKKRNERNFSKKIKYACRKTLADSRPRVRGRFAKNDDFGEATRTTCSTHEEDDEEVVIKEEEMIDSSDIFAHISCVNSFNCNYPIQSWI